MDYDSTDIPVGYDQGRDHGPEFLELWMDVVASCVGNQRLNTILDLGLRHREVFRSSRGAFRCGGCRRRSVQKDAGPGAGEVAGSEGEV